MAGVMKELNHIEDIFITNKGEHNQVRAEAFAPPPSQVIFF